MDILQMKNAKGKRMKERTELLVARGGVAYPLLSFGIGKEA